VLSIWCDHLKEHFASLKQVVEKLSLPSSAGKCSLPGLEPERMLSLSPGLSGSRQAEAVSVLHAIRKLRELDTPPSPRLLFPVYYTLALLHTIIRELQTVRKV